MTETLSGENARTDSIAQFHLMNEIRDSEDRKPWQSGIYSKTLLKKDDLRIVLIVLEQKAKMQQHHADGTISIQMLKGKTRIGIEGESVELSEGSLMTVDASIAHDLEALEESALLLTISWPSSQELQEMPHRGYGS